MDFTKLYREQARLLGRTIEAVRETIRICKDGGVLREYLSAHEKEVVSIMMALFDQEKAVEQFGYEKKQEGRKEGYNELLRNLVKAGELSPEKAAQYAETVCGK